MSLPNNDRDNVILGSNETIASTVLNRSISRLHQNDVYLDKFVGKVAVDSDDLSAIENASVYLENKIVPGSGITISVDDTVYGKALRIYASTDQVVSSVLSGVYVSGAVTSDNIATFAGTVGTSAYIKNSGVSITTVSDHLDDYDNPHQVTLSTLVGVNISGAVNNDILMLSGTTWVATPNPLISISASFDDDRNDPLSAKALLYYGEETNRPGVGGSANHSYVKVIQNSVLTNGTKYAYVLFTAGNSAGYRLVQDPNSLSSEDASLQILSRGYNAGFVTNNIADNQLKFKHLFRYNDLIYTGGSYIQYCYQGTFVYDTGDFVSIPSYTCLSATYDYTGQYPDVATRDFFDHHTNGSTLNYLKVIGEQAGTSDVWKGAYYIYIFEYNFLKWYLGGGFNDPLSENSVYHNGSSMFGT